MPKKKYGDEGEGLFHDDGPAPEDMYSPDEFADEQGDQSKSPILVRRRRRWKICGALVCLAIIAIVVVVVFLGGGVGGGGSGDGSEMDDKGTPLIAPTPAPIPSTASPVATVSPTITAMPTRPMFWELEIDVSDSVFENELMGSSVDVSGDGSVVWIGAFNYTAAGLPTGVGRIRRLEVDTGNIVEVFGSSEKDSLGYQVCGSADGEFVAGFASANGTLFVLDYLSQTRELRTYAQFELPDSWEFYRAIIDFSKDGNFLAVTGTEIVRNEVGVEVNQWTLRVFRIITGAGGAIAPYGPDIVVEDLSDEEPELYSLDMTEDGSVIAVGIVGVGESNGRIRVFQRQSDGSYAQLGSNTDAPLLSEIDETEDFFARRLQVRTIAGQIWLMIGWEFRNTVLMRRWTGSAWVEAGELTPPGEEFSNRAEFGYDIDISGDGSRMVVGARGFNSFQGAAQMFQLNSNFEWESLGQIIVGYEGTFLGEAVAISSDGSTIVMGAPEDCSEENVCGGAIYVYRYIGPNDFHEFTAPPAAEPAPSPIGLTSEPTATVAPTYDFSWEQINGVFDTIDQELFAAALSMSDDGTVLYAGAFENGEVAPESGRIVRVDLTNNNAERGFHGEAYDFLGFDVSSNGAGDRVVGYLSSSSSLEVSEYNPQTGFSVSSVLETYFNSTSATFEMSADGNWLVAVGVVDPENGGLGRLTIKTYQRQGTNFVPFGDDVVLEEMDIAPTLDIHMIRDGTIMALSVAGWNSYLGKVRVFRRLAIGGWEVIGTDIDSDRSDDFFGKTVRLTTRVEDNLILLFVSAPYRNEVLVYSSTGAQWSLYGQPIQAGSDFTAEDEFGFDIDISDDGNRVVVGVRCFDSCRGAVQTFEYDGSDWIPIGQIIAGFADSYFGEAVVCSETCEVIAVGAPEDCGSDGCGGSVYVFQANDNRA